MRRARAARPAAVLVAVTALLALAPAIVPAGAVPPTADGPGIVTVTLTSMTPVVPRVGDTLTISGVVTNRSSSPVDAVEVRLRVSPTPVRSRSEIPEILEGTAGRTGVPVEATRTPVTDGLAPDASAPFTFSVPLADLDLSSSNPQVVVLGVESLGDPDSRGVIQTGFTRTFLPWFPDPTKVKPTRVVWLYPLTTAPSRTGEGVFLDDHLGVEVGPSGRLTRLLDAAASAPAALSWVVDPQLLESLIDMSDGYDVRGANGTLTPGTASSAATAWLARLRTTTASADVSASAYADPDVVALHRAGLDVDIALAATTAGSVPDLVLGRAVPGGLAWPPGGLTDDGTLDVLRAAGARVVVLSADALPASPPVPYTPSATVDLASGGSPLRALAFDPTISELVGAASSSTAAPADDPVGRRQTVLAELAMTTLELPSVSRSLVIAPSMAWSTDVEAAGALALSLTSSPWASAERLETLVSGPVSEVPRTRADYPASARKAELSPAFLAGIGRARTRLAGLRAVAPDVAGSGTAGLESALTRTESAAWRADPASGRRLFASVSGEIESQIAQVQVLSKAPVTLPGDAGRIPVTVANDLDRPARVGVRLTGTPTVRFEADDVAPVTLAPGQKTTLEVAARVIGTGPVAVDIVLLTPEGQPFGQPVRTEVRSAAYARAAQWVVIGLFGVTVVLLGVNLVRRRRPGSAGEMP